MSFQIDCPCGRKLKLSDQFRGRKVQCYCEKRFRVSEDEQPVLLNLDSEAVSEPRPNYSPSPIANPGVIRQSDLAVAPSSETGDEGKIVFGSNLEDANHGSAPSSGIEVGSGDSLNAEIEIDSGVFKESGANVGQNRELLQRRAEGLVPKYYRSSVSDAELPKSEDNLILHGIDGIQDSLMHNPKNNMQNKVSNRRGNEIVLSVASPDPLTLDEVSRSRITSIQQKTRIKISPLETIRKERGMEIVHKVRVYSQFKDGWFHSYLTSDDKDIIGYSGLEKKDRKMALGLGLIAGAIVLIGLCVGLHFAGVNKILSLGISTILSLLTYLAMFFWKRPRAYIVAYRDNERREKLFEVNQRSKFPFPRCRFDILGPENNCMGSVQVNYPGGKTELFDEEERAVACLKEKKWFDRWSSVFLGTWLFRAKTSYSIFKPNAPTAFATYEAYIEGKDYGRLQVGAPGSAIEPKLFYALLLILEFDN